MASVQGQLRAFRREMEADGTAQHAECRRLVATAVRRARELVDDVLQVRTLHLLSLPIADEALAKTGAPGCGLYESMELQKREAGEL